jgi:hypothetical protein
MIISLFKSLSEASTLSPADGILTIVQVQLYQGHSEGLKTAVLTLPINFSHFEKVERELSVPYPKNPILMP